VYIEQPYGFMIHGKESHVCKLKKASYGLKHAPRAWYARIDGYLMSLGFSKSVADANLYYKIVDGESMILILYVDDLFLTEAEHLITWCKHELASEFEMKDLRMMHYFLGLEVWQRTDEIFLSQGKYTVEILRRFGILDCKSMTTPMVMNLKKPSESMILILYVDDLFLTEAEHLITWCKHELASEFEMKDLRMMHYFLGLEVWQRTDEIFLSQGKYTVEILRRFGILDCKSMTTPMVMNLKKLSESSSDSDLIDPTIY
jgi:hypothetical protein